MTVLPALSVVVAKPVGKLEAPPTSKVPVDPIVNVPVPVKVKVFRSSEPFTVTEVGVAAAVSVTMCPLCIVTVLSRLDGTEVAAVQIELSNDCSQVVVLFQSPVVKLLKYFGA